ncbi:MAG: DUF1858 domain-containing protein [Chloroflexi bacterium]|nr:DUF1858 domain-containing protein [Chloroflexota bacterium]
MTESKVKFHKNMLIGEVVKQSPEASKVIEKYFGRGCFTCPGIKMESLAFGSTMHGVKVDKLVEELNQLV